MIDGSTDGTTLLITGAGANWNASGEWIFDLSGFGGTVGDTFSIISGSASYDAVDFSVAGATKSSTVWSGSDSGVNFEFDESTGILEIVAGGGGGGTTYVSWSGGAAAGDDTNGDGVTNNIAYVLGAADVNANAIGLLPTIDDTDPIYLIFNFRRHDDAEADGTTAITAKYGSNLTSWTDAVDPNPGVPGDDVDIIVHDDFYDTYVDRIEVKLHRANLSLNGKLFALLQVTVTP